MGFFQLERMHWSFPVVEKKVCIPRIPVKRGYQSDDSVDTQTITYMKLTFA